MLGGSRAYKGQHTLGQHHGRHAVAEYAGCTALGPQCMLRSPSQPAELFKPAEYCKALAVRMRKCSRVRSEDGRVSTNTNMPA